MSSKKKRKQGDDNASNRNLDGRRLRTIGEAKALAHYLAVRPEMDKRERDERRRRWLDIIDLADRKEGEIRRADRTRLDGAWVEAKAEAAEKTRDALLAALRAGTIPPALYGLALPQAGSGSATGSTSGSANESDDSDDALEHDDEGADENDAPAGGAIIGKGKGKGKAKATVTLDKGKQKKYFGWDDDDDLAEDDDEDDDGDGKT